MFKTTFNTATRLFAVLGAVALGFAVVHGTVSGDTSGTILLAFASVAALTAAVSTYALTGADLEPQALPGAGAAAPADAAPRSLAGARRPGPSPWPVVGAVAAALLAVGATLGAVGVSIGVGALLVAAGGWFAWVWREHEAWSPRFSQRVGTRFLTPLALPLVTLALIGVIVVSFSRVLLALTKEGSTLAALVVAVVVLAAFAFLAARRRRSPAALAGLAALAGVAVVGAGVAGAVAGEREFERHPTEVPAMSVIAQGLAFTEDEYRITVPEDQARRVLGSSEDKGEEEGDAGGDGNPGGEEDPRADLGGLSEATNTDEAVDGRVTLFDIVLNNLDDAVYHNVAIYEEPEGGVALWAGTPIDGTDDIVEGVDRVLEPGEYWLRCDFHPGAESAMTKRFLIDEGPVAEHAPSAPPDSLPQELNDPGSDNFDEETEGN